MTYLATLALGLMAALVGAGAFTTAVHGFTALKIAFQ